MPEQADDQEGRGREWADRETDRHLPKQRRLRDLDRLSAEAAVHLGHDGHHAEIVAVGVEQQAERHGDQADYCGDDMPGAGRHDAMAAWASAFSMPVPVMMPVKAPAASRMAAISSAALACASMRARCSAGFG